MEESDNTNPSDEREASLQPMETDGPVVEPQTSIDGPSTDGPDGQSTQPQAQGQAQPIASSSTPSDGRHVPRGYKLTYSSITYIEDLEKQVQDLENQYRQVLIQTSSSLPPPPSGRINVGIESGPGIFAPPPPSNPLQQPPAPTLGSPINDPLSFENTLFQAIKLSGSDPLRASAPNLLFGELSPAFGNVSALTMLRSMSRGTVLGAIKMYFEFVHAHYPLLIREDVTNKYNMMMRPDYEVGTISSAEELVVYLVVVVGMTVSVNLRSAPLFPQMLYYAALRIPNVFDDVESIPMTQALILIVIYSLYDPCAGSTLGNGIESTAKAWAFWTLYSLDRMAGASMGRPFTIANDDLITVPVPGLRDPGTNDDTGFLSGPLITYFQLLYRARRDPDAGFAHWHSELEAWRNSTKLSVSLDIQTRTENPYSDDYLDAMNNYIDLIFYQGILLIPQFDIEFPTVTPDVARFYGTWTAGYKAFATAIVYLLSLSLIDRSKVTLPEVYHVSTACINTIENVASKFDGLSPYARFLVRAVDMMLRLYNVEGRNNAIADDPYFLYTPYSDVVPRSPNSGIPRPPDVADLHVRKFRSLGRLLSKLEDDICDLLQCAVSVPSELWVADPGHQTLYHGLMYRTVISWAQAHIFGTKFGRLNTVQVADVESPTIPLPSIPDLPPSLCDAYVRNAELLLCGSITQLIWPAHQQTGYWQDHDLTEWDFQVVSIIKVAFICTAPPGLLVDLIYLREPSVADDGDDDDDLEFEEEWQEYHRIVSDLMHWIGQVMVGCPGAEMWGRDPESERLDGVWFALGDHRASIAVDLSSDEGEDSYAGSEGSFDEDEASFADSEEYSDDEEVLDQDMTDQEFPEHDGLESATVSTL
ncbi:hypothetical protein Dda_7252 [Drechslerella dactyloides]|uniref:Transcription factor domain-containing protein n=1 Tax=Drechslerella dactyloides TaxID=74499 RepID=A0AAD6NGM2_DREDA|nr:hypothetical protein Dda_7252 [Drechslerella dactyloides]